MNETWNKTGLVVGSLDRDRLFDVILHCKDVEFREKVLIWLEWITEHNEDHLVVSVPYHGKGKPTVEE